MEVAAEAGSGGLSAIGGVLLALGVFWGPGRDLDYAVSVLILSFQAHKDATGPAIFSIYLKDIDVDFPRRLPRKVMHDR
jgi:hypothetical protein